jgi:hypothetical protein
LVVTLIAIFASVAVTHADSTTTLLGYQIDFAGVQDNGDNTSTWTYAVTSDGNESQGLSHWTLQVDACYQPIIAPANESTYTTPTDASFGCGSLYNCAQVQCTVVHGTDPTTGINGIKYENCEPQLDRENQQTHIFQFTVRGVPNRAGYVQMGAKAGDDIAKSEIQGPVCSPNAVSIQELSAQPEPAASGVGRFVAQMAMTISALGMRIMAHFAQG